MHFKLITDNGLFTIAKKSTNLYFLTLGENLTAVWLKNKLEPAID